MGCLLACLRCWSEVFCTVYMSIVHCCKECESEGIRRQQAREREAAAAAAAAEAEAARQTHREDEQEVHRWLRLPAK